MSEIRAGGPVAADPADELGDVALEIEKRRKERDAQRKERAAALGERPAPKTREEQHAERLARVQRRLEENTPRVEAIPDTTPRAEE